MSEFFLLRDIIVEASRREASDIHIQSEFPVFLRIHGVMTETDIRPSRSEIEEMLNYLLKTDGAIAKLYDKEEYDVSYSVQTREGPLRFRVNVSLGKEGVYIVMRRLKRVDAEPATLGVPDRLIEIVGKVPYGLVFIAGPTGSGKSTTLASLLSSIAKKDPQNIVTIEDPIEYELVRGVSLVVQREVGKHTLSFARALRAAMRQDPDTILVGEVRDPETAVAAMQAAKSGHIVFSTIHTSIATQIPGRVASMFKSEEQPRIVTELMESMVAGVVQALVPTVDGKRALVTEVMDCSTTEVRDMIRQGAVDQVRELMRNGRIGWTLNMKLAELIARGLVTEDAARGYTNDLQELDRVLEKSPL